MYIYKKHYRFNVETIIRDSALEIIQIDATSINSLQLSVKCYFLFLRRVYKIIWFPSRFGKNPDLHSLIDARVLFCKYFMYNIYKFIYLYHFNTSTLIIVFIITLDHPSFIQLKGSVSFLQSSKDCNYYTDWKGENETNSSVKLIPTKSRHGSNKLRNNENTRWYVTYEYTRAHVHTYVHTLYRKQNNSVRLFNSNTII